MKLRLLAVLILLPALAFGSATVTGKVSHPGLGVASGNNFVLFDLQGCGNNPAHATQPAEASTLTTSTRFPLDASGNIVASDGVSTAAIIRNDQISCGGQTTSTFYLVTVYINNSPITGQPQKYRITASPFDLNTATPITVNPVVTPPTGDSTYARKDAGNLPFTSLVSAPGFDGAETTAPACAAGVDYLWPDSIAHRWKMCNNGGAADQVVGADATQTLTNKSFVSPTSTGTDAGVETLANKSLTSPTVTGTDAGAETFSGVKTFTAQPLNSQGGNIATQISGACSGTATASTTLGLYPLGQLSSLTCTTVPSPGAGDGAQAASAGTIKNLQVFCRSAGVNASSGLFTVLKNNVATAMVCTVGTLFSCFDSTHSFTVNSADRIGIQFTTQIGETIGNCQASVERF